MKDLTQVRFKSLHKKEGGSCYLLSGFHCWTTLHGLTNAGDRKMLNRRRNRNRHKRAVLALAGLVLAGFVTVAHATDDGTRIFAHPEWSQWFAEQVQPNGQPGIEGNGVSCCNQADGHILDDADVRIVGDDYEVRTAGGWLRFPNKGEGQPGNTVLGYVRNPTGHAVAWYLNDRPFCFAPGTGA